MAEALDVAKLRSEVQARGFNWVPQDLPPGYIPPALGRDPAPPEVNRVALETAQRLMLTRMPQLFAGSAMLDSGPAALSAPAGSPALPRSFDWRSRGVIGPVTDQEQCGSCVSFATTGLVGAMSGIEHGSPSVHLSEADQHFCSAHGPNCGGWNNGDALNEIKHRGVVANADFVYDTAFDTPRVDDPGFLPEHLWRAHCRSITDRNQNVYRISEVSGWNGDDRKTYLAHVGPLVCGFTVYTDFDHYGIDAVGVYRHVMGKSRGGHAVLVVGYSDDEHCWICRNSWGAGWGGKAKADGVGAGFFKIGYGECGIDNEPFYGAHGVTAPAGPGLGGMVASARGRGSSKYIGIRVSRAPNKLDIFCVGTDHGTYTAAWEPGFATWHGWWRVQGGVAAPNTSISAVSRSRDKLDISASVQIKKFTQRHGNPPLLRGTAGGL